MRSKQGGNLISVMGDWKPMEAIQSSWEHKRMITLEDGGIEAILKDFTLQSCYFALQSCEIEDVVSNEPSFSIVVY